MPAGSRVICEIAVFTRSTTLSPTSRSWIQKYIRKFSALSPNVLEYDQRFRVAHHLRLGVEHAP